MKREKKEGGEEEEEDGANLPRVSLVHFGAQIENSGRSFLFSPFLFFLSSFSSRFHNNIFFCTNDAVDL